MSHISEEIIRLHKELPQGVGLVAVSKFHPAEAIRVAYDAGQRIFGESRVQELLKKIPELPNDIRWHFIGHLQTNKIRSIIGKTAMIESVDSVKVLSLIDVESRKANVLTNVLLQVHVAEEETKSGFYPEELLQFFRQREYENLTNVHICGLMGMATNTSNVTRIRKDFGCIASLMKDVKALCPDLRGFSTLSMGMSGDWPIAVEEGATLVRVGTAIFGARNY